LPGRLQRSPGRPFSTAVTMFVRSAQAFSCPGWRTHLSSASSLLERYQPACKPGSVWSCLRDGHSSGMSVAGHLEQPTRAVSLETGLKPHHPKVGALPTAPIRFCSRWGLPCRGCYQHARCAFTTPFHPCCHGPSSGEVGRFGGLLSVALSLGSPPAAVSRHRVSMEPGLSSTGLRPQSPLPAAAVQPAGPVHIGRTDGAVKRIAPASRHPAI